MVLFCYSTCVPPMYQHCTPGQTKFKIRKIIFEYHSCLPQNFPLMKITHYTVWPARPRKCTRAQVRAAICFALIFAKESTLLSTTVLHYLPITSRWQPPACQSVSMQTLTSGFLFCVKFIFDPSLLIQINKPQVLLHNVSVHVHE